MSSSLRISPVVRILGGLLIIEAAMLTVPLIVSLLYGESDWAGFAVAALAAGVTGIVMRLSARHTASAIRAREGFVITATVWVVFGLFGVIPFMMSAAPLSFTDAFFEVTSGFTTTGASVIADVEAQSHGILFWRALTQWVGGLGIILFMLAVLPELNRVAGISMFNAEATGITHDRLHPRIRQTALSLWGIYAVLTVALIAALWAGPMNLFDSICHSFATIATGGFSTKNDGLMHWHSDYVLTVVTVFMFIAGVNFMLLFAASRKPRVLGRNDVFRTYSWIVAAAFMLLVISVLMNGGQSGINRTVLYPLFHVVSAITSTGFGVEGAETWGAPALLVTILLMMCGACAGSTTGGMKVDRLMVMWRNFVNETRKTVFPKRTYVVTLNGSALQSGLVGRVTAFVTIYMVLTAGLTAFVTFFGYGFTDSLFMVSSCLGCNGLGYGATGAEGGFGLLPDAVKWVMTAAMLAGRLEIFTFVVVLMPEFWRR